MPGKALSEFIDLSREYVKGKRAWLLDEFGADDYGVKGAVVVGSVAAGTERPDSDIDLYVTAMDDSDVSDFLDGVQEVSDRYIDFLGAVLLGRGEVFEPEDWKVIFVDRGYYSTAAYHIEF